MGRAIVPLVSLLITPLVTTFIVCFSRIGCWCRRGLEAGTSYYFRFSKPVLGSAVVFFTRTRISAAGNVFSFWRRVSFGKCNPFDARRDVIETRSPCVRPSVRYGGTWLIVVATRTAVSEHDEAVFVYFLIGHESYPTRNCRPFSWVRPTVHNLGGMYAKQTITVNSILRGTEWPFLPVQTKWSPHRSKGSRKQCRVTTHTFICEGCIGRRGFQKKVY